ncbi:TetR family transcriptional regulator [Paracoccus sp. NSM]|uniref:TetR family transcriptional regulator n=1 Tax=Paracoccus sp. NSM TaxID=3457784 RepID=UPI0040358D6F
MIMDACPEMFWTGVQEYLPVRSWLEKTRAPMPNLSRDLRRTQIINAAVELTMTEGLNAATVRRVASAISVSPGQIHHHFTSADALRAEAFRVFGQRLAQTFERDASDQPAMERALTLLDCKRSNPEIDVDRLWKEAMFASREADLVREAVRDVLVAWQDMLADALSAILAERGLQTDRELHASARRLIAMAIGSDLIADFHLRDPGDLQELQDCIEQEVAKIART